MRHPIRAIAPATAAALLMLSACSDEPAEVDTANLAVTPADDVDAVIFYPAGTAASLDTANMRSEVERMRAVGAGAQGETSDSGKASGSGAGADQSDQGGGVSGADGTDGTAAGGFASVDVDGDGRLTPAEYAIHRLPSETAAREGATNDEQPPYVSDEALNEVATGFRQLDTDGDFYLSEQEFQAEA